MSWNRKSLLKMGKENGFTGKTAGEFVDWAEENLLDVRDPSGEKLSKEALIKAFNKTVTITASSDAGEPIVFDDASEKSEDEILEDEDVKEMDDDEEQQKQFRAWQKSEFSKRQKNTKGLGTHGGKALSAASHDRIASRKRYDRKAARGETAFTSADMMESANACLRLSWLKSYGDYSGRAEDMEIFQKAGGTFDNTLGGFLVPGGVSDELIELKATYGVARQLAGVTSMPLPKWDVNRFGDDVVVYKTAEGSSMAESDPTFGQVTLLSEELGALSNQSNRLLRLSAVDIGDAFSRSVMRGFAKYEDDSYLNGANGFEGLATKVGSNSTKDVTGLTNWSGITLTDLLEWKSMLPGYTDQFSESEIPITCTRTVFDQVFRKHALAQGGSLTEDFVNSGERSFDGHPIILNNSMARTFANNAIAAFIGPFKHVTKFGELEGSMSFDSSEHRNFDKNQMVFRGLEEIAINCHDVSDTTESGVIALQVGT